MIEKFARRGGIIMISLFMALGVIAAGVVSRSGWWELGCTAGAVLILLGGVALDAIMTDLPGQDAADQPPA